MDERSADLVVVQLLHFPVDASDKNLIEIVKKFKLFSCSLRVDRCFLLFDIEVSPVLLFNYCVSVNSGWNDCRLLSTPEHLISPHS